MGVFHVFWIIQMLPNRATHHKYFFCKIFKIRELEKLEFAKSRAKHAYVPTWSACQRAYVPAWFTYQRASVPTCQKRANFSFLRANVPINVPMHHTACKCFKLACQRVKRRATFSNIPHFQKFYIILDIIVIHIMCTWCIVHKNCIRLYFYTLCHIMEKCVELFFFNFLSFVL